MFKGIKLELEAEEKEFISLDGQSRICNWLYNHLLEMANKHKEIFVETQDTNAAKIVYSKRGLRNLLPDMKKELPFLKSVHSSPLKNTALRVSAAIQEHQKGKKGKRKNKSGWPQFRSWKKSWFSLFYDEPNKGWKLEKDFLIISLVMGCYLKFHIKEASILKNKKLRNLRIIRQAGHYYAIFTVENNLPQQKPIRKVIAFDPNHKNMAYGVDCAGNSIEIAAPYWLKRYDKRIDEIKSKRDHCQKKAKKLIDEKSGKEYFIPSKRWQKYNKTLEIALHKRREQTKVFMFTISNDLCREYDCVGVGDYTPQGGGCTIKMRRAMNNRSLIGRFKEIMAWTAKRSGKLYIEYDEKGTTRTCNYCGYKVEDGLSPSIRKWECPVCKATHIRDENAAQNGLKKVLRELPTKSETSVSLVPGSGLDFIKNRWAWRVLPSGVEKHLRGKDCIQLQASGN